MDADVLEVDLFANGPRQDQPFPGDIESAQVIAGIRLGVAAVPGRPNGVGKPATRPDIGEYGAERAGKRAGNLRGLRRQCRSGF